MKKSTKLALAAAVLVGGIGTTFAGNEQTADEARDRLDMLRALFKDKGLNSFNFLNGHDSVGSSKNRENQDGLQWAELTKSDDRRGHIICIENGRYAVHQLRPMLVGKDAMTGEHVWRDGQGMPMVEKIIAGLRNSPDGKAVVDYVETTKGVYNERQGRPNEERFELLAYSSRAIFDGKNPTGSKFFCSVRYKKFEPTDISDYSRKVQPDYTPGERPAAKKRVKKQAVKAQSAATEKEATPAETAAAA